MSKGLEALERIGKQKYKTTVADITGFETVTVSVKQDNKKDYNIIEKALEEHEQHKAIEEELGIDLLTFVKVLKAPEIYVKRKNEIFEVLHCDIRWDIVVNSIAIVLEESKNHTLYSIYHLRDYGKTWALTKEELL